MIADISLIDNQENVLAYHNISNRFNIGINNISLNAFKSHIDFFKEYHYLKEFRKFLKNFTGLFGVFSRNSTKSVC